eukprot:43585-Eustigmatos_ZCMA.PRE.1
MPQKLEWRVRGPMFSTPSWCYAGGTSTMFVKVPYRGLGLGHFDIGPPARGDSLLLRVRLAEPL